jgi:four helix bundle protein
MFGPKLRIGALTLRNSDSGSGAPPKPNRAAISIAANIAEGFKKRGLNDKLRFLNFAQGSLEECRYYLILIQDLGYGSTSKMETLLEEVSKLLAAYAAVIEASR